MIRLLLFSLGLLFSFDSSAGILFENNSSAYLHCSYLFEGEYVQVPLIQPFDSTDIHREFIKTPFECYMSTEGDKTKITYFKVLQLGRYAFHYYGNPKAVVILLPDGTHFYTP